MNHAGLMIVQNNTIRGQAKSEWREFNPSKFIIACILTWVSIITFATIMFIKDSSSLTKDSELMQTVQ